MILSVQESSAPPDTVLAALRARAGEWRESQLPDSLRRRGMLAITSEIRGRSCIVSYDWPGHGPDHLPLPLRVVATVTDRPDGGSRVEIRCQYRSGLARITAMCALVAVVPLLALGQIAWPAPIAAVSWWTFAALIDRDTRSGPTRKADPEAAYLVERVEAIVAHAGSEHLEGARAGESALSNREHR